MFKVKCPECKLIREVRARQPWMRGEEPFEKICRRCCQLGKTKSLETRQKLSEAVKKLQTPEVLEKKRQFMVDHPECWKGKLKEGGAEEYWTGETHSEETKQKISEGVRNAKKKGKQQ